MKVFDREAGILQNPEKQIFGQILAAVYWNNYGFAIWMLQNWMGTSLAAFGVSVMEEKAQEFAGSRHYSIATETVSV
jgi:hypothetical protein